MPGLVCMGVEGQFGEWVFSSYPELGCLNQIILSQQAPLSAEPSCLPKNLVCVSFSYAMMEVFSGALAVGQV